MTKGYCERTKNRSLIMTPLIPRPEYAVCNCLYGTCSLRIGMSSRFSKFYINKDIFNLRKFSPLALPLGFYDIRYFMTKIITPNS